MRRAKRQPAEPGTDFCTSAPIAPRCAAAATNSPPSNFGPRSATNSDPAAIVRLSVDTAP